MKSNSPENRREQFWQQIPEDLREIKNWPGPDELAVDAADRPRFKRLCRAANLFLKKQPIAEVIAVAGTGERQFLALLSVALRRRKDAPEINGTRAFVRGLVQPARVRLKPFEPGEKASTGYGGLFEQLMRETPAIETALIEYLNGKERPNKITPHVLHQKFLAIVALNNVQRDGYPFNTKSRAYGPLQKWYREVYMPKYLMRHVRKQHGPAAVTAAGYEVGDGGARTPPTPYLVWVIDEARVDLNSIVEVAMARWDVELLELTTFPVLICRSIGAVACNIAWHISLQKQASGADVIQLFRNAVMGQPVAPMVEPSMTYNAGAGFPPVVFPLLKHAVPLVVYLDNALSHLYDDLQHLVQRLYGGRVVLGKPADPKGRPDVESAIGRYLRGLIHQLPSTLGTGPLDPVRKNSAVEPGKRVPAALLEQATDVYLANENVTESAGAGYLDSFTRLQRMVEAGSIKPNYLPELKRRPHHFSAPKPVIVNCDLEKGRLPHVNFLHRRYSSAWLKTQPALRNRRFWALADYDDLRTVVLVDDMGAEFATLICEGQWGLVPHDLRMIKIYAKHKADAQFKSRPQDVPLFAVLSHLANKSKDDSASALDLAYILRYLKRHLPPEEFQSLHEGEFNPTLLQNIPAPPPAPVADRSGVDTASSGLPVQPRADVLLHAERGTGRFHVPRSLQ